MTGVAAAVSVIVTVLALDHSDQVCAAETVSVMVIVLAAVSVSFAVSVIVTVLALDHSDQVCAAVIVCTSVSSAV